MYALKICSLVLYLSLPFINVYGRPDTLHFISLSETCLYALHVCIWLCMYIFICICLLLLFLFCYFFPLHIHLLRHHFSDLTRACYSICSIKVASSSGYMLLLMPLLHVYDNCKYAG